VWRPSGIYNRCCHLPLRHCRCLYCRSTLTLWRIMILFTAGSDTILAIVGDVRFVAVLTGFVCVLPRFGCWCLQVGAPWWTACHIISAGVACSD
jgi:hypothetical protein